MIAHNYAGSATYQVMIYGYGVEGITAVNFSNNPISQLSLPAVNIITNINGDLSSLSAVQINGLLANLITNNHSSGTLSLLGTKLPTGQGLTDMDILGTNLQVPGLETRGWDIDITAASGAGTPLTYVVSEEWDSGYGDGTYLPYEGTPPEGSSVYFCALGFYGSSDGYLTVTPDGNGGYLWIIGISICTTMYGSGSWSGCTSATPPNTSGTPVTTEGGSGENGFPAAYTFTPTS